MLTCSEFVRTRFDIQLQFFSFSIFPKVVFSADILGRSNSSAWDAAEVVLPSTTPFPRGGAVPLHVAAAAGAPDPVLRALARAHPSRSRLRRWLAAES